MEGAIVSSGRAKIRWEPTLLGATCIASLASLVLGICYPEFASAVLRIVDRAGPITEWLFAGVDKANEITIPRIRVAWDSETARLYEVRSRFIILVGFLALVAQIICVAAVLLFGRARNILSRNPASHSKGKNKGRRLLGLLLFGFGSQVVLGEFTTPDVFAHPGRHPLTPDIPSLLIHGAVLVACSWLCALLTVSLFIDDEQLERELVTKRGDSATDV